MRRPAKVVGRDENSGEKRIRESQLATAQKKLDRLQESLDTAQKHIADAKKSRDDARAEFRKATADKRQALQAAQHRAAELAARAREAERGTLTPEKLKARATALEAYVPLYPELEKDRLLATLTTAP
jgi:chromosome segregation ATPase